MHGAVVDEEMVECDVRVIRRNGRYDATPQLRHFKNVRFIDRGDLPAALPRQFEGHAGDAFDLAPAVRHRVDGVNFGRGVFAFDAAGGGVFIDPAWRAVVETTGKFPNDYHVNAIDQVVLQGRRIEQSFVAANWSQIGVNAHRFADAE